MLEILGEMKQFCSIILASGSSEHHCEGTHQNLDVAKIT